MSVPHQPVLLREVLECLITKPDGVYVDGTIGAGGYAAEILKKLSPTGKVIGIDRDPEMLERAADRLREVEPSGDRWCLYHGSFEEIGSALRAAGKEKADGILLDLGVSSVHLDSAERGFSFRLEGPLDMRFDRSGERKDATVTAAQLIGTLGVERLEETLKRGGEEVHASRIAQAVVKARRVRPIETTTELAAVIQSALPWARRGKIHPATRAFQALRIAVNRELERLESFLREVPPFLGEGGRLALLSYHSLEDRTVKQAMRRWFVEGSLQKVTSKPIRPSWEEVGSNPRSRSAKLRVAEKNS